jgi:hypothetical protein
VTIEPDESDPGPAVNGNEPPTYFTVNQLSDLLGAMGLSGDTPVWVLKAKSNVYVPVKTLSVAKAPLIPGLEIVAFTIDE